MKHLNKKSTHIFLQLLKKLDKATHIKFQSGEYMALHLEYLHAIEIAEGKGKLYTLSHTYVQEGDLMRDPEMCFIVEPGKDSSDTFIYPQLFRQDNMGIYQESVRLNGSKITGIIPVWQASHCAFANMWLNNIREQGFLK